MRQSHTVIANEDDHRLVHQTAFLQDLQDLCDGLVQLIHLSAVVTTNGLDQWKTAAHYHLVHAVVLYFLADKGRTAAWWLMFAGILGFSGSLYLYAVTHVKFLVAITPFGGVLLMIGWGLLAFCGGRKKA